MAQLDRLLTHVISKAGSRLELRADRKPRLELKNGQTMDLLPNALPAVMVEVLAGDVVPPELKATWLKEGQAEFDHDLAGQAFRIVLSRYQEAPQIQAEHLGPSKAPAAPAASAPAAVEAPPAQQPASQAPPLPPAPKPQAPRASKPHGNPLAERLLAQLLEVRGSDLHCTAHEPPLARVDGDLRELEGFGPLDPATLLEMMEALATPLAW